MRTVLLVAYDVTDDKRLRKAYSILRGFGDPLQYSVFRCELSPVERQLLRDALWDVLEFDSDRVMVVDLGPAGGRGDECVEFWGTPRVIPPDRQALIV